MNEFGKTLMFSTLLTVSTIPETLEFSSVKLSLVQFYFRSNLKTILKSG